MNFLFVCFLSHEHILFFLSLFQRLSTDNFAINFITEGIFFLVKCLQAMNGKIIFDLGTTCLLSWALLLTTTLVYFCGKNSPSLPFVTGLPSWLSLMPDTSQICSKKAKLSPMRSIHLISQKFLAYLDR